LRLVSEDKLAHFTLDHRHPCETPQGKDFSLPLIAAFKRAAENYKSIDIDPEILAGVPHIAGTRIPVYMVLEAIEQYGTLEGALKSYRQLTIEQVKDAVLFAAQVVEQPVDYET
jgi:uncharacterized protein (DUF433 family)